MRIAWKKSPEDTFVAAFAEYADHIVELVVTIFELTEPEIKAWMDRTAPWQDQTGDARRLLKAETHVDRSVGIVAMKFSHGVPYGVYLETMQGGRFSILAPAVDIWGPHLFELVEDIIGS